MTDEEKNQIIDDYLLNSLLPKIRRLFADLSVHIAEGQTPEDIILSEISRLFAAAQKDAARTAINSLSYSELTAAASAFSELSGSEGIVVTSKIAEKAGLSTTSIQNALRKLESAGMVETRSLGVKGTHIKVLNDFIRGGLEDLK